MWFKFPFEPVRQTESVICQTDHIKCYLAKVSDDIENDLVTWKGKRRLMLTVVGRGCGHLPPCLKSRQVWCMCTGEGFNVVGLKLESQDAHVKPCFHKNPMLGLAVHAFDLSSQGGRSETTLVYIVSFSPATVIQ